MRALVRAKPLDSAPVCAALDHWLATHPDLRQIAVFVALPGEVDLAASITRHPDRCWLYPRVTGEWLTFHAVTDPLAQLNPGAFGILEPSPALPAVAVEQIDAFLCPGLAFDPNGGRLGRGRGFYDRMLARGRSTAVKVGVCFSYQIVPDTCQEPHDMPMDIVISG